MESSINDDNDAIIVPITVFVKAIQGCSPDDAIVQKCKLLISKYFSVKQDTRVNGYSKWRGGGHNDEHRGRGGDRGGPTNYQRVHKDERPRIGARELSREEFIKKEFMATMNKLTNSNQQRIIAGLKDRINPDYGAIYIKIVWDLMKSQPSNQRLYLNVCETLRTIFGNDQICSLWQKVFEDYVLRKDWTRGGRPPPSQNDYDAYCDYVKWKKQAINAVTAYNMLINVGFLDKSMSLICGFLLSEDCFIADRVDQLIALVNADCAKLNIADYANINDFCGTCGDVDSLTSFKLEELSRFLNTNNHNQQRKGS